MMIDAPRREQIPALRRLWMETFGDTEDFLDIFERTAFDVDRCRCVTVDGETVAALYWFDCSCRGERFAYLYAISTAKSHRGRGICGRLMEDTHRYLALQGYEGAILVPGSPTLFDFYGKAGYRTCSEIRRFNCTAGTEKAELRRLFAQEYAALRRVFLPEGGVVQEHENIDFLQSQAVLYGGEGFLLAAREEGDSLYGIEFLGAETYAPKILCTLGYAKGSFRTAGEGIPFAMYRSLSERALLPPAYFGLAFD